MLTIPGVSLWGWSIMPLNQIHNMINRYLKIVINFLFQDSGILERAELGFITSEHEYPMRIQALSEFGFLTLMKKSYFDYHDL